MSSNVRSAVGVFAELEPARRAVAELRQAGFREDQVGVMTRAPEVVKGELTVVDKDSKLPEGAVLGAAAGAGLGALWAVGVATVGLPVLGPALAGGVLVSALAGVAEGAAVGGVVGALVGFGIPTEEARHYETQVAAGRTLVTVHADERHDEAVAILQRHGGSEWQLPTASAEVSER